MVQIPAGRDSPAPFLRRRRTSVSIQNGIPNSAERQAEHVRIPVPPVRPIGPPVPRFDGEIARQFLAHILDAEVGVSEIRVLKAKYDERNDRFVSPKGFKANYAGWYDNIPSMITDLSKVR